MRWAAAFPIPSLPPVMMATFPVSPKSMSPSLLNMPIMAAYYAATAGAHQDGFCPS
jgi:hypothetical protein